MKSVRDRNAVALAVLRIGVGVFFFLFGEYKVFGSQFTLQGGFEKYVGEFVHGGAYPFMVPVLQFILAHTGTPMAFAVAYGEFLIGISLLIGVWTRMASFFGLLLMLAMWMSGGYPGAHAALWMYFGASLDWSVFALCFVVLMVGEPEAVWALGRRR
jgi:uncharacterized membrane protein YphA (DoxX/SURF4 family)